MTTYLRFGAMCVDTINGKFDVFHFTTICYWCQFDDSMEWHTQIWQFIWKISEMTYKVSPSKQLKQKLN